MMWTEEEEMLEKSYFFFLLQSTSLSDVKSTKMDSDSFSIDFFS